MKNLNFLLEFDKVNAIDSITSKEQFSKYFNFK